MEATSREIPNILNEIFFAIRMLKEKCKYYSQEERIANLFRKVSNQIIKRCSLTINLNDLFEGNIESCMEELTFSKKCGKLWRQIYKDNFEVMPIESRWNFEPDSVFA